jgi:hypothetical protein
MHSVSAIKRNRLDKFLALKKTRALQIHTYHAEWKVNDDSHAEDEAYAAAKRIVDLASRVSAISNEQPAGEVAYALFIVLHRVLLQAKKDHPGCVEELRQMMEQTVREITTGVFDDDEPRIH